MEESIVITISVMKQDRVAPLVADPSRANSTTDTDTHPLSDIGDTRQSFSMLLVPLKRVPYITVSWNSYPVEVRRPANSAKG